MVLKEQMVRGSHFDKNCSKKMTKEYFARDQTYASALEALTCASVMPDGKGSHAGFKHAVHEALTQHPLVLLLAVRSVSFHWEDMRRSLENLLLPIDWSFS